MGRRTMRMVRIIMAAGVAVVTAGVGSIAVPPAHAGRATPYRAVDLGFAGRATAINDKRQVAGEIFVDDYTRHPVLWERGRHIDLGLLAPSPDGFGTATDINNRGQVVGHTTVGGWATQHAFRWDRGVMTDLGTLGGPFSHASAINDQGQVVGTAQNGDGVYHGFLWENGRMTDLGAFTPSDINNRGQISGVQSFGDSFSAMLLDQGRLTRLDLRTSGTTAINDAGTVVGYLSDLVAERNTAYLWRAGRAVAIGPWDSQAFDVNSRGDVLVATAAGISLWRHGRLTSLSELGVPTMFASAIALNNRGDVIASQDEMEPVANAVVYLH